MSRGYQPKHSNLDTNNPPDEFTAIQRVRLADGDPDRRDQEVREAWDACVKAISEVPIVRAFMWVEYRILDGLLWLSEKLK